MIIFVTILKIFLFLFSVGIIILIFILLIPLRYSLSIKINDAPNLKLNISLIYKLISFKLISNQNKTKFYLLFFNKPLIIRPNIFHNRKSRNIKHKDVSKDNAREYLNKEFLNYSTSYLKDMTNMIKPYYLSMKGTYGFENPATTGIVCAVISMIQVYFSSVIINLEPSFNNVIFDIKIEMYGEVLTFSIIYRTLKFLFNKEVRKRLFKKSKTAETY